MKRGKKIRNKKEKKERGKPKLEMTLYGHRMAPPSQHAQGLNFIKKEYKAKWPTVLYTTPPPPTIDPRPLVLKVHPAAKGQIARPADRPLSAYANRLL